MKSPDNHTAVVLGLFVLLNATSPACADLEPTNLRCEYRIDPLGIDVTRPRLSWELRSDRRGQKQTAYRVLVAGNPETLAADRGDLWDSGMVDSEETIHISYTGEPLVSRTRCYWKVRVWDAAGKPSAWSEPATWSMGLLSRDDWHAQWISHAAAAKRVPTPPQNGFHTALADNPDVKKWVAIDLGEPKQIDAVQLHPARPFNWKEDVWGFLFPLRFKIETAVRPDFSDARIVIDKTGSDVPNPGTGAPVYRFAPVTARYVRLTATRLRERDEGNYGLALAEMQVLSGEKDAARGCKVTSLDSIEKDAWSRCSLTDGRLVSSPGENKPMPVAMLRKEFEAPNGIERATLHITARGLYEARINGHPVGDHLLAPEWTEYDRRIQYQTYDVTDLVRRGKNAIGVLLADGWYAGRIGMAPPPGRYVYGNHSQLLVQLEIDRADGSRQVIVSDPTWQSTDEGPIRYGDILDGEVHDLRRATAGWDEPGYNDRNWQAAHAAPLDDVPLVWQPNEPIRVVEELRPVNLTEPKPGVFVFDLGQNMVGWCRVKLRGPAGTRVRLRHAERLAEDGAVYTANLRGAPQTDQVILTGDGEEVFEPKFTYHGFRYVELTGLPDRPKLDDLVGRAFCSSSPRVGEFQSSNELVNRLMRNILWVQRGNMHSTPTDCPQRDERLGWMGDAQCFSQTAIFNMDMAGFYTKWLRDVRDAQLADGRFAHFAPAGWARQNPTWAGVPGWADAGVIVPWRMYVNYGDKRLLAQHFDAARRWADYVHAQNPNLLWLKSRGHDFNDWLNGDRLKLQGYPNKGGEVPKEVFATAFFAHSNELVAKMAAALGRDQEANLHRDRFEGIKAAFNREFVDADGRIRGDTQAGYALALRFNLLLDDLRPKAVEHLLAAIARYDGRVSTGIQTTHRMMLELTRNGRHDEACRLINLRTVPSWGYMIDQGATTIWERWDGYVEGRGFQDPGMNSFNHWAFGSVGDWVWRNIVGINPDEDHPAFKDMVIRPRPGPGFTWAKGTYHSIRGPIAVDWKIDAGRFHLAVDIPPGSTATVHVPTSDPASVTEDGNPAADAEGVQPLRAEDGTAVFAVQSGRYRFTASRNR